MNRLTLPALALASSLTLLGCFDDGEGVVIPDEQARVEGRVETPSDVAAQTTAQASTVAVVSIEADGSLTSLAEADIDADGTFRVTGIPVERGRLQVVARSETEAEVGRTLVHGETEDEVTITVAPITPEATVEGRVAAHLRASGRADAASNSGGIDLLVRLDDSEANLLLESDSELEAYADGFATSDAWVEASAEALVPSFTTEARVELLTDAALAHADSRDGGTAPETAHETFVEATLDAFVGDGVELEALAMMTATQASGAAGGSASASAGTRLELIRQAVGLNLRARERLAAEANAEAPADGGLAIASVLASARTEVMAATSLAEIEAALEAAGEGCEDAMMAAIDEESGGLELALEVQVAAAIALLFTDADLSAALATAASTDDAVQATTDFQSEVSAGVDVLVELLDGVLTLDSDAMAGLVVASRANGSVE